MIENKALQLASNFVQNTNRNVFLTGKAGTGKTTFLHKLKQQCNKRMVIVAPTGVAAINAKGVTIHSFFQLPFGPILPGAQSNSSAGFNMKFSKTKIDIIRSLDLLVIDEISMVRADLLDGIDKTLRRFKNRNLVFGGTQLLMIGDLQQLSPVVKDNEWRLLSDFYDNAFFFSSKAYQQCNAITIELKHIYRQSNPLFIDILNEIRNNKLSQASADELNKRYQPNFRPKVNDGYISLTTHNNRARQINVSELNKITTKSKMYEAVVKGNFPSHAYPNEESLELKVGAQVMFIKNDSSPEKRYFNGKIGRVVLLDKNEVVVHCPDDDFNIITKPEVWDNIKYNVNAETKAISEDKIGSYEQIPLRLAWSITIHKSQGLTFERAIIDAEAAFAHGQTYVALSRCKSLEGLVLKSKITPNQIISDSNVDAFNKDAEANQPNEDILKSSERKFQLDLISEIFDFYNFLDSVNRLLDIYYKNKSILNGQIEQPLNTIKTSVTGFLKVNNTFKVRLDGLTDNLASPESCKHTQEQFVKAINYFNEQTKVSIRDPLKSLAFTTDNTAVEKDMDKHLNFLHELLSAKLLYFEGLKEGFKTEKFLNLRAKSVFLVKEKTKALPAKTVVNGTSHVVLYESLRLLRNGISEREDLVNFQIFPQKTLYEMCDFLPRTLQELKQIHGMGKTRIEKYGEAILKVITDYCEVNDIEVSNDRPESKAVKPLRKKGETYHISLSLYQAGKSLEEIAIERALNPNTILGHLAQFVSSGEIKITDLMSKQHYDELKALIPTKTFENLSDLKHQLDDKYSFGEIRLVLEDLAKS